MCFHTFAVEDDPDSGSSRNGTDYPDSGPGRVHMHHTVQ